MKELDLNKEIRTKWKIANNRKRIYLFATALLLMLFIVFASRTERVEDSTWKDPSSKIEGTPKANSLQQEPVRTDEAKESLKESITDSVSSYSDNLSTLPDYTKEYADKREQDRLTLISEVTDIINDCDEVTGYINIANYKDANELIDESVGKGITLTIHVGLDGLDKEFLDVQKKTQDMVYAYDRAVYAYSLGYTDKGALELKSARYYKGVLLNKLEAF